MAEVIVRAEHVRRAGLCARGMRQWFKAHDLDLLDFINNGMPESKVVALNDALANRALEIAKKEVTK
ncbi:hypothetical protein D3C87_928020 [compost metagenome]